MSVEEKVRLYEGTTEKVVFTGIENGERQYELWPRRRSDRRELAKIIAWCVASLILSGVILWAGTVRAVPGSMSKGIICDTLDQLIEHLDTGDEVEGCGMFFVPMRVPVDITILGTYDTALATLTLARIIIPGIGIQYGYVGVEEKTPEVGA